MFGGGGVAEGEGKERGGHLCPGTGSIQMFVSFQICHCKQIQCTIYTKQIISPLSVSGFLASPKELLTKKIT